MPMVFPTNPTVGQVFSSGGRSWVWNGSTWDSPRTDNPPLAIPTGNFIINGGFDIWQRGTSVTHAASTDSGGTAYTADRFRAANVRDAVAWRNITVSRSTNIPPSAGVKYSARVATGANDVNRLQFEQIGEDWDLLAGMSVTFSFYIRRIGTAHSSTTLRINLAGQASHIWGPFNNLSTSEFTRITRTFTATTAFNTAGIQVITDAVSTPILNTAGDLFEITGVQVEAGTVATPFRRNAPSIQAELAACQRYYWAWRNSSASLGLNIGATFYGAPQTFPVEMRVTPSISTFEFANAIYFGNTSRTVNSMTGTTSSGVLGTRVWQFVANVSNPFSDYTIAGTFGNHEFRFNAEL